MSETLEQQVRKISSKMVRQPYMVRSEMLAEVRALSVFAKRDKADFLKRRFEESLFASFDEHIDLFAIASSLHETTQFQVAEKKMEWDALEKPSYTLKWDGLEEFNYCFREFPELLKYVARIAQGRGRRDLACDFVDMAALVKANQGILEEEGFDPAMGIAIIQHAEKLSKLLGDVETTDALVNPHKLFMEQAFTAMITISDRIRETGQHIFRNDEEKLKDYKNSWYQKIGGMRIPKVEGKEEKEEENE